MITAKEVIHIGTLSRPHGKSGEIQCRLRNDYWEQADAEFVVVAIDGIFVPFRVEDWREKGVESLIFQLKDVDSEEEAVRLCGNEVYMLRRDWHGGEGEEALTWQDLTGWTVWNMEGEMGVIDEVDDSTINILAILKDGTMVPLHEDLIMDIDQNNQKITINYQP